MRRTPQVRKIWFVVSYPCYQKRRAPTRTLCIPRPHGAPGCELTVARDKAAVAEFVVAAGYAGDGIGVGLVLFHEDAGAEGVGVVGFEDRDGALQDDYAMVEVLVDKVDCAASYFYAVIECLALGFEAGEGGKQ